MLELAWKRALAPGAAANHNRAGLTFAPDRLASLSAITAPTTIVHGDQDPVFPLGHGEALAAAIPEARLHVVPGMGHVWASPGLPELIADQALEVAQPGARAGVLHAEGGHPDGVGHGGR
jgi:pimeloyl-ACP methyl ester carboxylesterase